ncbi:zinc ABC transporter [Cutibacterium acnes JCM 18918]|nr:zinc ABC transporter [Cutibacterium acnes JCM 18918]
MIHARDLAFAIHGTSELSFAGAAVALFFGASVTKGAVVGSLVAASSWDYWVSKQQNAMPLSASCCLSAWELVCSS